jgi:hypothetical protein
MLDVRPSRDDGTQDHESEGEKSHGCDRAAEPKNLAVGDQDDRQILEDGVDGNGQISERFGTGIDHSDEEDGYREPWASNVRASAFFPPPSFSHVHFFASSVLKSRYVMTPADLQVCMATTHTIDCRGSVSGESRWGVWGGGSRCLPGRTGGRNSDCNQCLCEC